MVVEEEAEEGGGGCDDDDDDDDDDVALMAMKSREQSLHVLCFTCLYMHSRTNAAISLFGSGSRLFFPVDIYQV